ncbi:MAG: RNase adapter RapZ [Sporomusaceae bacterium]|jgi:UPF0042 nucleotide-binding protein|nr:RNase adapter RapZ [Sporomusaceae bacterium]
MKDFRLVIITGMSGSGKSYVMRAMEDLGYFCVDNLPPFLIPKFAEICTQSGGSITKIALVVDIRGREFFGSLTPVLEELDKSACHFEILFLEASDTVLIRRYKETRRHHPMSPSGRLSDGIAKERDRLERIRGRATHIIDTSELTPAQLRAKIVYLFASDKAEERMPVSLISFGFKYGMPMDADLVFDVRFLPNPFYVESLRRHSGLEMPVSEYIAKWPVTEQFLEKLFDLINFLLPQYVKEGKNNLIIATGCTGGLHRSVFIAEKLADHLKFKGYTASVEHRDLERNLREV